ncbi:MAG: BamA/TamA family outer membrane protein [Pedobacter sp.]
MLLLFSPYQVFSQQKLNFPDSTWVTLLSAYDSVGKVHRLIFGENYRKDYAYKTKVPIIRLSQINGGLFATQRGGGNQSKSIRLEDRNGKEWVLRSVEKYPEILLPPNLRETFARDILKDNMSAQHPFSALVVPVFAAAIGATHSNPVIGWVEPDVNLGEFDDDFANTVALLEERNPVGPTDNSMKMSRKLVDDNDNTIDADMLLKLKCLDVLLGDWDRHYDQWRWVPERSDSGILYHPQARDRDQVFYRSDGKIQRLAQSTWLLPMMQGYERDLQNINWFLWEGREIYSRWFNQIDEAQWIKGVDQFCAIMTDELFDTALKRLPEPGYSLRKEELFKSLSARRKALPQLMLKYYRFFNSVVDIELSNKSEWVEVVSNGNKGLLVTITKSSKSGEQPRLIYKRDFDHLVTKEIRIYLHDGQDKFYLNNQDSKIRIRLIGGEGEKTYTVNQSKGKVNLYDLKEQNYLGADLKQLKKQIHNDTAHVAYVPKDLYARYMITPNFGINNDDGLALGLGIQTTSPGFRKAPYGNTQNLNFLFSFGTGAFKIHYAGEWLNVINKADFSLNADIYAPSNTQNFFGLGNQTRYDNPKDIAYYRARFNLYEFNPALSYRNGRSRFSAGPAYQYYVYNEGENDGRILNDQSRLNAPDSSTIAKSRMFAGAILKYSLDTRNSLILPSKGIHLEAKLTGYKGLTSYAASFIQLTTSISGHLKLDPAGKFIISDRIGGGVTLGNPAFYQNQFLGGQGNLLGYRQFRFAGHHSAYNNFEFKVKLANFVNYILPGQVGLMGLYDVGRVWKPGERSDSWHHGVGGGAYFAPASLTVLRLVAAHSSEGWYPYFAVNFRY